MDNAQRIPTEQFQNLTLDSKKPITQSRSFSAVNEIRNLTLDPAVRKRSNSLTTKQSTRAVSFMEKHKGLEGRLQSVENISEHYKAGQFLSSEQSQSPRRILLKSLTDSKKSKSTLPKNKNRSFQSDPSCLNFSSTTTTYSSSPIKLAHSHSASHYSDSSEVDSKFQQVIIITRILTLCDVLTSFSDNLNITQPLAHSEKKFRRFLKSNKNEDNSSDFYRVVKCVFEKIQFTLIQFQENSKTQKAKLSELKKIKEKIEEIKKSQLILNTFKDHKELLSCYNGIEALLKDLLPPDLMDIVILDGKEDLQQMLESVCTLKEGKEYQNYVDKFSKDLLTLNTALFKRMPLKEDGKNLIQENEKTMITISTSLVYFMQSIILKKDLDAKKRAMIIGFFLSVQKKSQELRNHHLEKDLQLVLEASCIDRISNIVKLPQKQKKLRESLRKDLSLEKNSSAFRHRESQVNPSPRTRSNSGITVSFPTLNEVVIPSIHNAVFDIEHAPETTKITDKNKKETTQGKGIKRRLFRMQSVISCDPKVQLHFNLLRTLYRFHLSFNETLYSAPEPEEVTLEHVIHQLPNPIKIDKFLWDLSYLIKPKREKISSKEKRKKRMSVKNPFS